MKSPLTRVGWAIACYFVQDREAERRRVKMQESKAERAALRESVAELSSSARALRTRCERLVAGTAPSQAAETG